MIVGQNRKDIRAAPLLPSGKVIVIELVENGKNGYVVPVDNSKEVAKKIKLILNDEKLCDDMGRESRRKIEGYTTEKMAHRHLEIMKSI